MGQELLAVSGELWPPVLPGAACCLKLAIKGPLPPENEVGLQRMGEDLPWRWASLQSWEDSWLH